jgi:LCP family protein required for cell wall assembly
MSDLIERGREPGVGELFDGLLVGPDTPPRGTSIAHRAAPPRRRRWLYVLGGFLVAVLAVGATGAVAVRQVISGYDHNIQRFGDPFAAIPRTDRATPDAAATGSMNILLLGSDSRIDAGNPQQWSYGAQRTDAIMVVHVQADRKAAYVVSIPRDSWVTIPGHGKAKINAAFSWGGPSLMIRTVESVTGVPIDHVVVADFTGFKTLTDQLGGVDITIPQATSDERHTWTAGVHHMDGEEALDYVRQRHNLPNGDFDRVRRQQNWIRAVLRKLGSTGTLLNPLALNTQLTTLSKSVATDSGFDMDKIGALATSLAGLGQGDLRFLTVPTKGTGWSPDHTQSIVLLDDAKSSPLWQSVRKDAMPDWLRANHPELLPPVVR